MAKYWKWLAGGLGWTLSGPIGGIIGFIIGNMVDNAPETNVINQDSRQSSRPRGFTSPGDFTVAFLVLIAAVMKADGRVVKGELDFVKRQLLHNFGEEKAQEMLLLLRDIQKQEIDLQHVCMQIGAYMDANSRRELFHLLFGLANADGEISESELNMLAQAAAWCNISEPDYLSIKAMFIQETGWAYQVLEVETTATDDELKKAYRRMALKYHPDKVSHLGEDVRKDAEERIKKLNSAWTVIKNERKMA